MRFVVFTGGPGAGKTTLLTELASMGYATVADSARAIIAERLANGLSPRPAAVAFAKEVLRRDIEKYLGQPQTSEYVFFDRGVVDALGLLDGASPIAAPELTASLSAHRYHAAFIFPPWHAIYATDSERDQSFAEAVNVHSATVRWYRSCGYVLHEVPLLPVKQRAAHVLHALAAASQETPPVASHPASKAVQAT
jgi:predicted ATPase